MIGIICDIGLIKVVVVLFGLIIIVTDRGVVTCGQCWLVLIKIVILVKSLQDNIILIMKMPHS